MSEEKGVKKETRQKIAQQMEFYFSDSNLSKDRFLKQEIQSASSRGGCKTAFLIYKSNEINIKKFDFFCERCRFKHIFTVQQNSVFNEQSRFNRQISEKVRVSRIERGENNG
jgi:hypothetical protein